MRPAPTVKDRPSKTGVSSGQEKVSWEQMTEASDMGGPRGKSGQGAPRGNRDAEATARRALRLRQGKGDDEITTTAALP
ncbi:hypothetical protein GCM10009864_01950 [Streptomyces lunalinharesii]|uniref:Uncharacterized protein n=1 Tax=Streptomyces lunalinharesii TaxID=333384 RepID=A0ABN3R522_9ACTN